MTFEKIDGPNDRGNNHPARPIALVGGTSMRDSEISSPTPGLPSFPGRQVNLARALSSSPFIGNAKATFPPFNAVFGLLKMSAELVFAVFFLGLIAFALTLPFILMLFVSW